MASHGELVGFLEEDGVSVGFVGEYVLEEELRFPDEGFAVDL